MPRCVTNIPRSELHNRPSPLTCRHRRTCDCEVDNQQGQIGQARGVSKGTSSGHDPFAQWNTEEGQLVLKTLNRFPEARDAIIDAMNRFFEAEQRGTLTF